MYESLDAVNAPKDETKPSKLKEVINSMNYCTFSLLN